MGNFRSSDGNICPVCDYSPVDINVRDINDPLYYYDCHNCGCFFAPSYLSTGFNKNIFSFDLNHLREYLFYNQRSELRPVLCDKDYYDKHVTDAFVQVYNVTPEMVENWYPRNFSEKVDLILQKLDDLAEYDGAYIKAEEYIDKLFFCENARASGVKEGGDNTVQLEYMSDFLTENGYVKHLRNYTYQLLPKALERIYDLRKNQSNSKNVFVSMAFNDGTKPTREAIRTAIVNAGYSPEFIDEIIHNRQIVPEMFRLIRECRFLILDISDPNYGAYYEAGYALGLGKEVIICCSDEVFRKDFGAEGKYRKPHFDIAQKQLLIWSNCDDLTQKLTEWIKAIVG